MGQGKSPTSEELEFVYGLFAKGALDADVQEAYDKPTTKGHLDYLPGHRDKRFVRQRRKEYEAAKKVLRERLAQEQIVFRAQSQHEDDLANAGIQFVKALRFGQGKYSALKDEQLGNIWIAGDDRDRVPEIDGVLLDCLLSHLKAEVPEVESLHDWGQLRVKDLTDKLLNTISTIALSRSFKGTCPSCPKVRHPLHEAVLPS